MLVAGELENFLTAGAMILRNLDRARLHPIQLYLRCGPLAQRPGAQLILGMGNLPATVAVPVIDVHSMRAKAHVSHPVGSKNIPSAVW